MMGCNCTDDASLGLVILCTVLPFGGLPAGMSRSDYTTRVFFPDEVSPKAMTCAGVDVYVQSVRWPFTRYDSGNRVVQFGPTLQAPLPSSDCITRGNCREVDATVWLIPRCGASVSANSLDACTLTGSSCRPFCMAARPTGHGRKNLFFMGAPRWREGSTLVDQDCVLTHGGADVGSVLGTPDTTATMVTTPFVTTQSVGAVFSSAASNSKVCQPVPGVISVTSARTTPAYVGVVRMSDAPFVLAGDTILSNVSLGGGLASVLVERLSGTERNVFSLYKLNQHFPAEPALGTPSQEFARSDTTKLVIPYGYQNTPLVGTASSGYVFYASNPAMDVFDAYFEYCARGKNASSVPRFGYLLESSYSPIRVYRVAAYRRCAAYSCGPDLVEYVTIAGMKEEFDLNRCDRAFNVSVTHLEYVNEDNIAVTVQVRVGLFCSFVLATRL